MIAKKYKIMPLSCFTSTRTLNQRPVIKIKPMNYQRIREWNAE